MGPLFSCFPQGRGREQAREVGVQAPPPSFYVWTWGWGTAASFLALLAGGGVLYGVGGTFAGPELNSAGVGAMWDLTTHRPPRC